MLYMETSVQLINHLFNISVVGTGRAKMKFCPWQDRIMTTGYQNIMVEIQVESLYPGNMLADSRALTAD